MAQDAVIVGVGMVTAVGLSAAESAAAVRAATSRFGETPMRDHRFEPFTIAEVPEDGLPPLAEELTAKAGLSSREMRLLRLATRPVLECIALVPDGQPAPGVVLALPETNTIKPIDPNAFLANLWQQCDRRFDPKHSSAVDVGRAGGLLAIARATEAIRTGRSHFMVAGGVDSYRDLYVLGSLDAEKRVKSEVHLDGFIPGEGAAFLLLASATAAHAAKLPVFASVSGVAHGVEAGHLYSDQPYRGDGLAATIAQLVQAGVLSGPIAEVWSSMNGESHWGKEWGVAYLRNRAAFLDAHRVHHPADCFGDTGAACGPAMMVLQVLGMRGKYRNAPALVYCSSDRGARTALALNATT
jgi:3-oxoacyl-[acyl-carrier-protein] synthase I